MTFRRRLPRALATAALLGVAALTAGCLGSSGTTLKPPHCRSATGATPAAGTAGRVAVSYLSALGGHDYDRAQTFAHACSAAQQHSLDQLWLWLDSMPTQQVKIDDVTSVRDGHGVNVTATLWARFGPAPHSAWVTLGPRTLELTPARGAWRVRADVSHVRRSDLAAYGVSWLHHPYFINGARVTVVYAKPADVTSAQAILSTAESVIPGLYARYGGGQAGLRPVIFLVDQRKQGEALAHVDLGRVRTPAGFQYSSFSYIDLPKWRDMSSVAQGSMVAHELTHVVTRPMLAGAPHSLLEGIAMYEENSYLAHYQQGFRLDHLYAYYNHHAFPDLRIWERRESDWGLPNVEAIGVAYDDALVMTAAIVQLHGGVGALRRLGAAFRAEHARRDFTASQVEHAFQRALHVSFQQVVAEARTLTRNVVATGG